MASLGRKGDEGEVAGASMIENSRMLRAVIADLERGCKRKEPETPLSVLKKILEFCEHYQFTSPSQIRRPLISLDLTENGANQWDAQLLEGFCFKELIDLIVAANIFKVEPLVHLGCAKIATLYKEAMPAGPTCPASFG